MHDFQCVAFFQILDAINEGVIRSFFEGIIGNANNVTLFYGHRTMLEQT